ncbi:MAG: TetR/AcrR family transcriptional regulator [Paracoccaceae bacterium]
MTDVSLDDQTEPEPKRQAYRKGADRRDQIAEAAIRCLMRHGYAKLTARKVAEEAGLSLGHITYHFKDMSELLAEAYLRVSANLSAQTNDNLDASDGSPRERLKAFLFAGFSPELLTPDYIRLRIDLWSAALNSDGLAETEVALYRDYRLQLVTLLQEVAAGQSDPAAICAVADAIMALLDGLWLDWMRRRDLQAVENGLMAGFKMAMELAPVKPAG